MSSAPTRTASPARRTTTSACSTAAGAEQRRHHQGGVPGPEREDRRTRFDGNRPATRAWAIHRRSPTRTEGAWTTARTSRCRSSIPELPISADGIHTRSHVRMLERTAEDERHHGQRGELARRRTEPELARWRCSPTTSGSAISLPTFLRSYPGQGDPQQAGIAEGRVLGWQRDDARGAGTSRDPRAVCNDLFPVYEVRASPRARRRRRHP